VGSVGVLEQAASKLLRIKNAAAARVVA
jgi:hypothetical protein